MRKVTDAFRNCAVRDLLKNPLWTVRSTGRPMPDSPYACAVSLPTWDSVIGYEEGRDRIMKKLDRHDVASLVKYAIRTGLVET